jgi:hypothetical protein
MAHWLLNYLIAFLLTIVFEVAVALLFGYRKWMEIAAIFWVNVFTHPLLIYLVLIINALRSVPTRPLEILLFEIGVVVVEWQLLCYALPQRLKSRLLLLSLMMNGVSYLAGLLLPVWFI